MTPATRSQSSSKNEETFEHLIRTVMVLPLGSDVEEALSLAGLKEGLDIGAMEDLDIDGLTVELDDGQGNFTYLNLPSFKRSQLRHMRNYLRKLQIDNGGVLTKEVMLTITKDEWDQYRIRSPNVNANAPAPASTVVTATTGSTHSPESIELSNFLKGIKRDKTQYPSIKDERDYHTWVSSFLAIANSHKIEEVFNPEYVPSNAVETVLFGEKQKFAYTVLDATLLTNMGKTLVRKHQKDYNAQKVWAEFVKDATASTKAQIRASELLSWITSAKYDNNWSGTSNSFVLYWLGKVQEYDGYVIRDEDRISDGLKLTMLQNTVDEVSELRQIKINVEIDVAKGGNHLTYSQYVGLLLAATNSHDKTLKSSRSKQRKQSVFKTCFEDINDEDEVYFSYEQEEGSLEDVGVDT